MWTAFPSPDYYGGSAPCLTPQVTAPLPADVLEARRGGRTRQGSHVHCVSISRVGAQLCSGSIATSTPQTFLVASRTDVNSRPESRLPVREVGVHCSPAQIRQIRAGSTITEVPPLVHSRYTFLPCSPDPDHLAVLARPGFVRAASHPPQRFLSQAALNFDPAAATAERQGSLTPARTHSTSWRTCTTWNGSTLISAFGSWSTIARRNAADGSIATTCDPVPPGRAASGQPAADRGRVAAVDDTEDLAAVGVHDGRHPRLDPPPATVLVAEPAHPPVAVLVDPDPTDLQVVDVGQQHRRRVHAWPAPSTTPPDEPRRPRRPPGPSRPPPPAAAARSRLVQRARSGNSSVAGVNVRRRQAGSSHTSLGLRTTTSTCPACGTSRTRCTVQACTRPDTTPQSGQPTSRSTGCTLTRRPPNGRSTASITR